MIQFRSQCNIRYFLYTGFDLLQVPPDILWIHYYSLILIHRCNQNRHICNIISYQRFQGRKIVIEVPHVLLHFLTLFQQRCDAFTGLFLQLRNKFAKTIYDIAVSIFSLKIMSALLLLENKLYCIFICISLYLIDNFHNLI